MKTRNLLALTATLCASVLAAHAATPSFPATSTAHADAAPAPIPPLTVAVLPFESSDEKFKAKAVEVSTLLWAQLSAKPDLWMVERSEVDKLLSEHALGLSGLTDPSTAVKAGNLLGAKVLITGRLIHTGDSFVLVAKIMSTATSRVFGATAQSGSADAMTKPASDLADAVDATLGQQMAVFTPVVETPEARLARLAKLTEGKKLPTIQVKIGEQNLTHPVVVDPAAQTEMEKMFSALGFEVIDPSKSGKIADVVITGSGLTQAGAHNGQLVSARARVEVQATRQSDGKVLAVDSETSVAVDTAPAVAGKTALENASATLVERLLSKLLQP